MDVGRLITQILEKGYVIKHIYADDYSGFREVIPAHMLTQRQDKANTYTIEQTNSDVRRWLARFRRRGKVVSRSAEMVTHSLTLLAQLHTNNNIQNLINHVMGYHTI